MPNIRVKNSTTASSAPSSLVAGELAINTVDGKVYVGADDGTPIQIIGTAAQYPAGNVQLTGGSIDNTSIGSTTPGTVSTTNFTLGGRTVNEVQSSLGSSDSALASSNAVNSALSGASATLKNIYSWTSNGTYTKSGSDVKQIRVICVGGGGGGRGYGESGGAGGFSEEWIDATGISSVGVTVGGGGGGGNYYGYSPSGGTSSFGSYLSAGGGSGANNNQNHTGGQGGVGYGGNVNVQGGGGRGHINCHSASYHNPGQGGKSYFGGGQAGSHYTSRSTDNTAWGSGGCGTNWYWNGGGNYDYGHRGRGGIVVVYEYK